MEADPQTTSQLKILNSAAAGSPAGRPSVPSGLTRLGNVKPREYTNFKARLVSFSFREIKDKAGEKTILKGYVEDKTFRAPLISHRIFEDIERDRVYLFKSAFVHEFEDSSIALILTEYSRVEEKPEERSADYFWKPTIGEMKRAIWNVNLGGTVTRIFSSSGLVKRCNRCRQVVLHDCCPKGCTEGWSWDLRVSFQLSDHTGSIRTVLARHSVARLLGRSVSEILYAANSLRSELAPPKSDSGFSYSLEPPPEIQVNEAAVENASSLRSPDSLLVTEGFNLVYVPVGCAAPDEIKSSSTNQSIRNLEWRSDQQDSRIFRKLVERSLDIRIRNVTKCPLLNGLYLLDSPQNLYDCEKAKLYSGFKTKVRLSDGKLVIDFFPEASILESVFDFVKWRRARGASANTIENFLLEKRPAVLTAPSGRMGMIKGVVWSKAGETRTSPTDSRSLVDYWMQIYGLEIYPDETPLLKVQPFGSSSSTIFTYPPSTAFFDERALRVSPHLLKMLDRRRSSARARSVAESAISELKLGDCTLKKMDASSTSPSNAQVQIFAELERSLCGKNLSARGQVVKFGEGLFFLPDSLIEVS